MSCCSRRRRVLAVPAPHAPSSYAAAGSHIAAAVPSGSDVVLRYRGLGPFTRRSLGTGRLYACGGTGWRLRVAEADASLLLKTRRFTRV